MVGCGIHSSKSQYTDLFGLIGVSSLGSINQTQSAQFTGSAQYCCVYKNLKYRFFVVVFLLPFDIKDNYNLPYKFNVLQSNNLLYNSSY